MMVSGTDKRIFSVTKNIGSVANGLTPDGRALMYRARDESTQYEEMFGINIPGKTLAERMALQCQMKTIYSGQRPFGSTIIFAAHDMMQGHTLWMVEPSGQCYQYYGCASGRGKQLARNEIERGNFRDMTVEQAMPIFAKLMIKAQEEMKEKKQELELSVLRADNNPKLNWVHKILDRATTDKITADAQTAIDEDEEMN